MVNHFETLTVCVRLNVNILLIEKRANREKKNQMLYVSDILHGMLLQTTIRVGLERCSLHSKAKKNEPDALTLDLVYSH